MNKKIGDLLGSLDNTIVNVIFDSNFLPEKYMPINDIEAIKVGYEMAYPKYAKRQTVVYPSNNFDSGSIENMPVSSSKKDKHYTDDYSDSNSHQPTKHKKSNK